MAILEFIFQDFWHWLGSIILFAVVAIGIRAGSE